MRYNTKGAYWVYSNTPPLCCCVQGDNFATRERRLRSREEKIGEAAGCVGKAVLASPHDVSRRRNQTADLVENLVHRLVDQLFQVLFAVADSLQFANSFFQPLRLALLRVVFCLSPLDSGERKIAADLLEPLHADALHRPRRSMRFRCQVLDE